ncbi:SIMPL domain-containing protein [Acaryochloris sp. IP29b_bin.148]|uniref:SIMPL domain-containing protein n=1 Tax=Acaryochloris sp. IP29b_bin.148 TaxID=2969218 RepID=UPI00261D8D3E|nr:SIMPL domain-containing protein [Acaryochloris sp. IP29b_bin.148]
MKLNRPLCLGYCVPSTLLGLTVLLGLSSPIQAQAQPPTVSDAQYRVLSVTGQGTETIQTTEAQVRLGVEVQGTTAEAVQKQVASRSAAVVSLLKARKVEKLETTGINLSPNYSYNNGQRRLMGYRGRNMVSFRVDIAAAGPLMDDAVKAGASRIDRVSFVAAEDAIAAAQKQALTQATQDAQAQARAVLSALNLSPKDVISIQINRANAPAPPPIPIQATALRTEADSTPVVGGEQSVQAAVTLHIRY